MDKKVIVDFDETLIRVNSFTQWVLFLWLYSIKRCNFNTFFSVSKFIFYRKVIKRDNHQAFKKRIIQLELPEDYYTNFSKRISKSINLEVVHLIHKLLENEHKIAISSAAPENYLKPFISNYFYGKDILVIGSTIENNMLNDNFGENKMNNLIRKSFLKTYEAFEILFTDSYHDLPLAKLADKVYLVKPKDKSRKIFFNEYANKVEVIE